MLQPAMDITTYRERKKVIQEGVSTGEKQADRHLSNTFFLYGGAVQAEEIKTELSATKIFVLSFAVNVWTRRENSLPTEWTARAVQLS